MKIKEIIKYILKKKRYILFLIIVCIIMYILLNALDILLYSKVDETRHADVAIVLGAAASDYGVSPVFAERINHAIDLYNNGYVQRIIITGGIGEGNVYSDSFIGKKYTVSKGIPEDAIYIEETSTITEENLKNSKVIMDEHNYKTALIVSDPLHMKRAMLQAKDYGIDAYSSPTNTSMYKSIKEKTKFLFRELFFLIGYKLINII